MENDSTKLLKKPKKVKCFKCKEDFEVVFNRTRNEYSKKNNWGYWTEKEEEKEKYICSKCLIYLYNKDKWEYLENITNLKKRTILRTYLKNKVIS